MVGTLPVLHLSKHRFDRNPALAVEGAAALGAQLAVHTLTRAGALRSAARCLWSFWVAMNSSHSSVWLSALASDQFRA